MRRRSTRDETHNPYPSDAGAAQERNGRRTSVDRDSPYAQETGESDALPVADLRHEHNRSGRAGFNNGKPGDFAGLLNRSRAEREDEVARRIRYVIGWHKRGRPRPSSEECRKILYAIAIEIGDHQAPACGQLLFWLNLAAAVKVRRFKGGLTKRDSGDAAGGADQ